MTIPSAADFQPTPLYGGAIAALLPHGFVDASNIRDIPSNQELYLSPTGSTSIIIDLLERAEPPAHPEATDDASAIRYHLSDVVMAGYTERDRNTETDITNVWVDEGEVHFARVPEDKGIARGCLATVRAADGSGGGGSRPKPDFTALLVTLLRLEEVKTDVLITINVPHVPGEYEPQEVDLENGSWGRLILEGMEIEKHVRESLEILDWSLFVNS